MGLDPLNRFANEKDSVEQLVLTAKFVGANPNPEIVGEDVMGYKCNYFLGNDPTKWHTDVPNYNAVVYKNIYPSIDLKYYGNGDGKMEYDFIIQPDADPSVIAIHYDGATEVCVDDHGQLSVETEWGQVTELQPMIYQIDGESRIQIRGEYVMLDEKTFGFRFNDDYQPQLAVVIDPVLSYSTYLGGSSYDAGFDIAVDDSGNAYVTGAAYSSNFPLQDPFQGSFAGTDDAFVTKLSASGNTLIYSTYLGGGDYDEGNSLAVDRFGCAYVVGFTISRDFPLQNPFQGSYGENSDAFVTKLSAGGNSLIYSTFLGGGGYDRPSGLAVDRSGNVYLTGVTNSIDFPLQDPFQGGNAGADDAFITKLSASGNSLVYSTYLGGSHQDVPFGLTVDGFGFAYVTGFTLSGNFPLRNQFQGSFTGSGNEDAFVTKLSVAGDSLIYSTYLGGSGSDNATSLAVDTAGCAYVTGSTWSSDFPLQNPFQGSFAGGARDAFVTKLSAAGNSMIYSTYLGGSDYDEASSVAVDAFSRAYVTGRTYSSNFPLQNPFQGSFSGGLYDAFVTKLSADGNSLICSTYLGGGADDYAYSLDVDDSSNAYVTGWTASSNFPLKDPFQGSNAGIQNVFVAKLNVPHYICGDANSAGAVNISDAVYLIAYSFSGGPAPNPLLAGDANCDLTVNLSDAVYLIAYIFAGGRTPCASCK